MLKNILFIVLGAVVLYVLFLYISYIDKEIVIGKYDGYKIGMTKDEVYHRVLEVQNTSNYYVMHPINQNDVGPLVKFDQDIISVEEMSKSDIWSIYFDDNYHNVIKFSFVDDRLTKIYRHRKYFEFP